MHLAYFFTYLDTLFWEQFLTFKAFYKNFKPNTYKHVNAYNSRHGIKVSGDVHGNQCREMFLNCVFFRNIFQQIYVIFFYVYLRIFSIFIINM